MSVYTTVEPSQLAVWLQNYPLGALRELRGIASGISNTNYFVTTDTGRYVLTLFEHNEAHELHYYLDLMAHLQADGVACPKPIASKEGNLLGELCGKPAALVSCLTGGSLEDPNPAQCAEVGLNLAKLHVSGRSFGETQGNPRGMAWWQQTIPMVLPVLSADDARLLNEEFLLQVDFNRSSLPQGIIHADLFRDNVLFDGNQMSGMIDFYFACQDAMAYDVAIAVNDWCVYADGSFDEARLSALLAAYASCRAFTAEEKTAWPTLLRAAALRFWVSRLYDFHFPLPGELTSPKDPEHFRRILLLRKNRAASKQSDFE